MHFHIVQHFRLPVVTERQIFYVKIFVIEILAVFHFFHRRLFRKKIQHSVAARKGLRKISGKSSHRDHGAERREHRHHTDNHSA